MLDRREEYVRDLAERNISRREILRIGAKLGLSMSALSAILAEADLASVEAAGNGPGWPKVTTDRMGSTSTFSYHRSPPYALEMGTKRPPEMREVRSSTAAASGTGS